MEYLVIGLVLVIVFVLTVCLLYEYANWKTQHVCVTAAVLISWYFAFLFVFLIPIDVASTIYKHCVEPTDVNGSRESESHGNVSITGFDPQVSSSLVQADDGMHACPRPLSYVNSDTLLHLWLILYWSSQFLTWVILPMMQDYAMTGEFSMTKRIWVAVKTNLISYGTYLMIFGVLLIYIAVKPNSTLDWDKLYTLISMAGNTWGIFLLVFLLGYGLVEVPRSCWLSSDLKYQLRYTQFRLAKVSVEKDDTEEEASAVLEEIRRTSANIGNTNQPLRKYMNVIISKCPEEFRAQVQVSCIESPKFEEAKLKRPSSGVVLTETGLVQLHNRLIRVLHRQFKMTSLWLSLLKSGFEYEDCIRNKDKKEAFFEPTYHTVRECKLLSKYYTPKIEWFWKCHYKSRLLKLMACICVTFSLIVVWSECTFFVGDPVLSIFAIGVKYAGEHNEYFNVQVVSFCIVAYLSVCAFYTVFRIRVFHYYNVSARHQTDENSLLFCAILLCRLAPPLCLNFLGLIHMDSHVIKKRIAETAFTRILGNLKVLDLVSKGFNIYFPVLIVLLCMATCFRLGTRCLNFCGFQQFVGDGDITAAYVMKGQEIMRHVHDERQLKQRLDSTRDHQEELLELVNNTSNFGRVSTDSASGWLKSLDSIVSPGIVIA